jgi:hypothetical protein
LAPLGHEYTRDARALARSAHDLRLAVDQGESDGAVRAAFDRVSRNYHAVRDEIAHSDSLQARRDFDPVTDLYRAIEHELGIHADHAYLPPPARGADGDPAPPAAAAHWAAAFSVILYR